MEAGAAKAFTNLLPHVSTLHIVPVYSFYGGRGVLSMALARVEYFCNQKLKEKGF